MAVEESGIHGNHHPQTLFHLIRPGECQRLRFGGQAKDGKCLGNSVPVDVESAKTTWIKTVAVTRVKSLLVFAFYQFVGTWGIAFLAAFGLFSLFDVLPNFANWKPSLRPVHWVLTENPFIRSR